MKLLQRFNLTAGLLSGVLAAPAQTVDLAAAEVIAETIPFQDREFSASTPPPGFVVDREVGLLMHESIQGRLIYRPKGGTYGIPATIKTPRGDYLMMFPEGLHYNHQKYEKVNRMVAFRSKDQGRTWEGPLVPFEAAYSQMGASFLVPKGSERIYLFANQPIIGLYDFDHGLFENTPIGYRYSDDDGRSWSTIQLIEPANDPTYTGISTMRMCETEAGTWLYGTHEGDWSYDPLMTRQYVLRSEDQGRTWELLPKRRHGGWYVRGFNRMDEGRPIDLGGGNVFLMTRSAEGHLWGLWSDDDGKTWTKPKPTPLVNPDAPPMLYKLSDGKTLICFHHNRYSDAENWGLGGNQKKMYDRAEIWFSTSTDGGHTWSEPRFVFVNALAEEKGKSLFHNYQCSYMDMLIDGTTIHLFVPHRWARVLQLTFEESDLARFPTKAQLLKR